MNASLAISFLLSAIGLVSTWRILAKAGRPGWAALVPIYNSILLFQVAGQPGWLGVLLFLGGVASRLVRQFLEPSLLILAISMATLGLLFFLSYTLAGKFGKGPAFGIGMILLPFVFYPILAFGDAQYDDDARAVVLGLN